jgi:hypothetical protein
VSSARDGASGRYTWEDLNRECVCGHRLGTHTATKYNSEQPCLDCMCKCYKPGRREPKRKTP